MGVVTFIRGKVERYPYPKLFRDVRCAQDNLRLWGVRAGMRVGLYAENSYYWLVYDLALIDLGAISVAFTNDFKGAIGEELLTKYHISLLLISANKEPFYNDRLPHVAFIDIPNGIVRVVDRGRLPGGRQYRRPESCISSGSAGGLKGLVISRKGVEHTLPPITDAIGVSERDTLIAVPAHVELSAAPHVLCVALEGRRHCDHGLYAVVSRPEGCRSYCLDRATNVLSAGQHAIRQFSSHQAGIAQHGGQPIIIAARTDSAGGVSPECFSRTSMPNSGVESVSC